MARIPMWMTQLHSQALSKIKQLENEIEELKSKKEIYVLLADGDGTMRSSDEPFGVAVTSREEAEKYRLEGGVGFSHSYACVRLFADKDEAIKSVYPNYKGESENVK